MRKAAMVDKDRRDLIIGSPGKSQKSRRSGLLTTVWTPDTEDSRMQQIEPQKKAWGPEEDT